MKLLILVGTRPNFIKVTQFKKVAASHFNNMEIVIVHTGQHYDEKMADVFFEQFNLKPDYFLNITPNAPTLQIAEILIKLQDLIDKIGKPDLMLVPGDVNSTLAGALFANKSGIPLGHIESGLRSFDKTMPEEHNRILTDDLSDFYFVSEPSGVSHLRNENKDDSKIHFVGNTMIDTMVAFEAEIDKSDILHKLNIYKNPFVLMTMHRPATVDNVVELKKLIELINRLSHKYKVVFPIHPRTVKRAKDFNLYNQLVKNNQLVMTEPLDYFAFQKLIKQCSFILTDSGGIQEESTFRKKPCLTLRLNTERPITVDVGTNTLVPFDKDIIFDFIKKIEDGNYKVGQIPQQWDGNATFRILKILSAL